MNAAELMGNISWQLKYGEVDFKKDIEIIDRSGQEYVYTVAAEQDLTKIVYGIKDWTLIMQFDARSFIDTDLSHITDKRSTDPDT